MMAAGLNNYRQQMTIFVQLFAAVENQGVFEDGWLLMPRLNLITSEFRSSNNDDAWATKADGLGFAGMDRDTAFSLSQNDWLLIALSWAAQRDLRDYLDMWGYTYSQTALNHVASLGLPPLSSAFYALGQNGHCFGLDAAELPIDGRTTWSSSTKPATAKVAAFTPEFLVFDHADHDENCALGDHSKVAN